MSEPLSLNESDEELESVVEGSMPQATVESIGEELEKLREAGEKRFFIALDASKDDEFEKIVDAWKLRQIAAYRVPNAESREPSAAIIYTNDKNISIQISPSEEVDPMDFIPHTRVVPKDTRVIKFPERRVIAISNYPNIDRTGNKIENLKGITVSIHEILEIASK